MSSPLFWMPVYTESQFRGHVDATTQFSAAGSQRQRATSTPALQASVSRYTYPRPVPTHSSNPRLQPRTIRTTYSNQGAGSTNPSANCPQANKATIYRRQTGSTSCGQSTSCGRWRPETVSQPSSNQGATGNGRRPTVSRYHQPSTNRTTAIRPVESDSSPQSPRRCGAPRHGKEPP